MKDSGQTIGFNCKRFQQYQSKEAKGYNHKKTARLVDDARINARWLEHQGYHNSAGIVRELVDTIEILLREIKNR
jgi:hypothetical protein